MLYDRIVNLVDSFRTQYIFAICTNNLFFFYIQRMPFIPHWILNIVYIRHQILFSLKLASAILLVDSLFIIRKVSLEDLNA